MLKKQAIIIWLIKEASNSYMVKKAIVIWCSVVTLYDLTSIAKACLRFKYVLKMCKNTEENLDTSSSDS